MPHASVPVFPTSRILQCFIPPFVVLSLSAITADAQSITSTWVGPTGNWSDASKWSSNPAYPDGSYSVTIDGGDVTLDLDVDIDELALGYPRLYLNGHSIEVNNTLTFVHAGIFGPGTLNVNGALNWQLFSVTPPERVTINARGGVLFSRSSGDIGRFNGTLNCYGNSSAPSGYGLYLAQDAAINNMAGAEFNGSRMALFASTDYGVIGGTLTNYGTLVVDDPGSGGRMRVTETRFVNQGEVEIRGGSLDVTVVSGVPPFEQKSGTITLTSGALWGPLQLNGGSLIGNGTVNAVENNGLIAPRDSGLNFLQNALTLGAGSVLSFECQSTLAGISFPQINNVSQLSLGGSLQITVSDALQKSINRRQVFTLVSAQMITGSFNNVTNGGRLLTSDGGGSFVVTYNGTSLQLSKFKLTKIKRL
jgi:hypothetical protein